MTLAAVHHRERGHTTGRAVLVTCVLLYTLVVSVGFHWHGVHTIVRVAVAVGLCVPWLVSHRWPRVCFAVMAASGVVQIVADLGPVPADIMLLAGLYSLAVHASRTVSLSAAAVVLLGVAIAAARWSDALMEVVVPLLAIVAATCAVWVWGNNTALRRIYEDSLVERAAQLEREQVHLARIAAAEERARIARDLHDVISHSLSGILTLSEGTLRTAADLPDAHRESFRSIATYCRTSLVEFRTLLTLLHEESDGPTTSPTLGNIESLVRAMDSDEVDASLTVRRPDVPVQPPVQEAVYRVVQEALTNIRKHAGDDVTAVAVTIDSTDDGVDVEIADDGAGDSGGSSCGYGLRGMRERVDSLHGTLSTGSAPHGGFVVRASLPLSPPDGDDRRRA